MIKKDLASQLTNAKNNYIMGLAALYLFGNNESYPILTKGHATFGQYNITFKQVTNLLQNEKDRNIAVKEFLMMLMRSLIKESFELIKDYCNDSNQSTSFKAERWYQFARIIRNCLSHNFKFEFSAYDKRLLPVTWKARTITLEMDEQPLEVSFFSYVEVWELFEEFQGFVENRLQ